LSKKRIDILINTPDMNSTGGVANFFKFLKDRSVYNVRYNYIGGNSKSKIGLLYIFFDYIVFIYNVLILRPEIIHLNPSLDHKSVIRDSIFLLISRIFNRKVIVSWHGWKEKTEKKIEKRYVKYFQFIFNKSGCITVLNSQIRDKLIKWNIKVPIYQITSMYDESLLRGFNILNKRLNKNILFLSRVEKAKGIYSALEAFSKIDDEESTFTIAGTGSELVKVKDYVKSLQIKNVKFVGYVKGEDKREVFEEASVYILLSESEGMPISMLEAMAFGLAVITTPVGGIKDFFENGKMGYVTESFEIENITRQIKDLFDNAEKLRNISSFNHKYASDNFSASKVAGVIDKIYDQALKSEQIN